jgi:arylsulfatase A-like enzyme
MTNRFVTDRIRRIALPLLALGLLSLAGCRAAPKPQPDLLLMPWIATPGPDAETRFSSLLEQEPGRLRKIIIREATNTLLPQQTWAGRVLDGGASRQALFCVDTMRLHCDIGSRPEAWFHLIIHNPPGSDLTYRISLEQGDTRRTLFIKKLSQSQTLPVSLPVDRTWVNCRLVLETRGRGIGAWLTPRFKQTREQPRLVIIVVMDTVRADHTSLHGYDRPTTPNLDRLARENRFYRNAYSLSSWTLPAHTSLFSGLELTRHQVLTPTDLIGTDYPLLAEVYQKNGFVTAAFTGGGFLDDHYGFHRGFHLYNNNPGNVMLGESAEAVLSEFKHFSLSHWGEDQFVFLHTYQAHAPYKIPSNFTGFTRPGQRKNLVGPVNFIKNRETGLFSPIDEADRQAMIDTYDSAILYTDQTLVGGVITFLKEKGVYEQSTLVVLSDHGEEFFDHGSWEHGHSLYNELVRIPLVIKFPGKASPGEENALVSIADIPGMILKTSGFPRQDRSLFPLLAGSQNRQLTLLLPVSPGLRALSPRYALVNEQFHYIFNVVGPKGKTQFDPPPPPLPPYELYSLGDQAQMQNLATRESQVLREYNKQMIAIIQRLRTQNSAGQGLDEQLIKKLQSLGYLNN